jgi:hypothetical protein
MKINRESNIFQNIHPLSRIIAAVQMRLRPFLEPICKLAAHLKSQSKQVLNAFFEIGSILFDIAKVIILTLKFWSFGSDH